MLGKHAKNARREIRRASKPTQTEKVFQGAVALPVN